MNVEMLLAATDGSPSGNEALRAAVRLANEARGSVAVVTAVQDPWQWIESCEVEQYRFNGRDPIGSVLTPRVRARLEPTIRAVVGTQAASHMVRLGVPAVEIPRAAEIASADLLVLGRGPEMGRTIEGTVRRAEVPCLVVPCGRERFQRVLAAVDVGPYSTNVLDAALALAEADGSDVLAFHVEPPPAAAEAGLQPHDTLRHVDAVSSALHTAWERAPAAVSPGVAACELIVRQGDPVSEILKAGRDERIDLLVVGCHRGEGGYQSQAIASRLLRRAACAVLTVPI